MSRIKISEYGAKKLLLGSDYRGVSFRTGEKPKLKAGKYVVKVDQGVKKRFKQGLVAVGVPAKEAPVYARKWAKRGYSQYIAEPYLIHAPHEEQYLSIERVRGGLRVLHAALGGVDIERNPEAVSRFIIPNHSVEHVAQATKLPIDFLTNLVNKVDENYLSFVEINPLVVQNGVVHLLDAAVLADSAGALLAKTSWRNDIIVATAKHKAENAVKSLQATTAASLKLTVLHPDGGLFFLLSGGGGSIVIADEVAIKGKSNEIGNYGEYSGGPTREETFLYSREVVRLLLRSRQKKKALIIAGGVANFTDVKATFAGVIDALREHREALRKSHVRVFVRRGGPNEVEGLQLMREFLDESGLFGSMYGSDAPITSAVDDALAYVSS